MLLTTDQGERFSADEIKAHNDKAILKKEVSRDSMSTLYKLKSWPMHMQTGLEDCADAFVAAAKNSSMTGQNIQIGKSRILGDYLRGSDGSVDSGRVSMR